VFIELVSHNSFYIPKSKAAKFFAEKYGIDFGEFVPLCFCRNRGKLRSSRIILLFLRLKFKTTIMKELVKNIQTTFESFQSEANMQLDGNKSAGTRARKSSLELEKLLKEFRKVSVAESKK
jgi:hypothetical protein